MRKWTKKQGYLCRTTARYIKPEEGPTQVEEGDIERLVESDGESNDGLEEDDEQSRLLPRQRAPSRSSKSKEGKENGMDFKYGPGLTINLADKGSDESQRVKISVEHHITYSWTYHCPQLLNRAWNESESYSSSQVSSETVSSLNPQSRSYNLSSTLKEERLIKDGSPLTLDDLLRFRILHHGAHLNPLSSTSDTAMDTTTLFLDPHSPFPLLQQVDHPDNAQDQDREGERGAWWGVHPCRVSQAVSEVLEEEEEEEGVEGGGREDDTGEGRKGGVRWLECWMMLSSGIVDLTN